MPRPDLRMIGQQLTVTVDQIRHRPNHRLPALQRLAETERLVQGVRAILKHVDQGGLRLGEAEPGGSDGVSAWRGSGGEGHGWGWLGVGLEARVDVFGRDGVGLDTEGLFISDCWPL